MSHCKGRSYIVTGASKGFGLAIVRKLLDAGANVALLARNNEVLQAAVAALDSDRAVGFSCDVASESDIERSFSAAKAHFGGLDGLINNAGLARPDPIESLQASEVLLQVNTNFVGTVLCCKAAIPLLRGSNNPRIINISSASAWHYDEILHLSIYAATKAAVERFSRDLRNELQDYGIGVSCIRPGGVMTDFAAEWDEQKLVASMRAWLDTGPHMDTGMEVEHVADAVRHCLEFPRGVAVDLLEVRPNRHSPKLQL